MNIRVVYTVVLLLMTCTLLQAQSIVGNVFWKYNEYVGSKPDAGSAVTLISVSEQKKRLEMITDIKGDFEFKGLDTGQYFVLIKSKNTTISPPKAAYKLFTYIPLMRPYVNTSSVRNDLRDSIYSLNAIYDAMPLKNKRDEKAQVEVYRQLMKLISNYYTSLDGPVSDVLGFLMFTDNIDLKKVHIKDKEEQKVVVDFGITYR